MSQGRKTSTRNSAYAGDARPDIWPGCLACGCACSHQTERANVRLGEHSSIQSEPPPNVLANGLPYGQAYCLDTERSDVPSEVLSGEQSEPGRVLCKKGFSAAQINILGLLLGVGSSVVSYQEIARKLEHYYGLKRTPEAVRQTVLRLARRGILRQTKAREGMLQGVRFQLVHELICPDIQPPERTSVRSGEQSDEKSGHFSPLSILEEIDRKNLSISFGKPKESRLLLEALSEEDINFHWPELARCNFGTAQIRQIIERREQVGEGVENIMQGLNFAEWELANDCMQDAKGKSIETPLNWVFNILAKQGYYPRPANYVSPVEQAERDRKEVAKNEQEAVKRRKDAEADVWVSGLSPKEREAILELTGGIQGEKYDTIRLRLHFWNEIWPAIRDQSTEKA